MQVNPLNLHPLLLTNLPTFSIVYPLYPLPPNLSNFQVQSSFFCSSYSPLATNQTQNLPSYPPLPETHSSPPDSSSPTSCVWIKEENPLKVEIKQEVMTKKEEGFDSISTQITQPDPQELKNHVQKMLTYILNNLGRVKESDISQERLTYTSDPILVELFDALVVRYSSTFKTKDEILKYITRKAFTTIRNNYKQKAAIKEGPMSETLCKRYFKASSEEIGKLGIDINHRENFLQVLFPYRKNCKNKTRYKDLIGKLDTSKEFYEDYCIFLSNFADIMQAEKERKVTIFVPFLCDCVRRKNIEDVVQYKRIPWLDTWIRLADITAEEISVALRLRVSEEYITKKKKF